MTTPPMTATTTEPCEPSAADPPAGCAICPRLAGFLAQWRAREPGWHNAPVASWVPVEGDAGVRVLIVGLAPGLRGANRTGRPFVGDRSGDALLPALARHGLATEARKSSGDGYDLHGCAITNAVRCVPPENRPGSAEINACRTYLRATVGRFANLRAVLTLGRIAHGSTIRAMGGRVSDHPFGHGRTSRLAGRDVVASYHCSRYNMNTGRLTVAMLDAAVARVARSGGVH